MTDNDNLVRLGDVFKLLISLDVITSDKIIPSIPPSHGYCCTCQICGRDYEECVCRSNEIIEELEMLRYRKD